MKMRYRLLDTLRGISVVSMILFHICWDLVNLYRFDWQWYQGTAGHVWQQSICWAFILISGFCMGLKKEEAFGLVSCKRGLVVLAAGVLVTVATLLFTPESPIIFGVLFFLGCAMLLTTALLPLLQKCSYRSGLLLTGLLFFLLRNINEETLGFENIILYTLPGAWYEQGTLATFVGFQDKNFFSTDYFSLIPWYFLFLAGYFLCRYFAERNNLPVQQNGCASRSCSSDLEAEQLLEKMVVLPACFEKGNPFFEKLGKHSLLIYLIHQPVILLLLSFILKPVIQTM